MAFNPIYCDTYDDEWDNFIPFTHGHPSFLPRHAPRFYYGQSRCFHGCCSPKGPYACLTGHPSRRFPHRVAPMSGYRRFPASACCGENLTGNKKESAHPTFDEVLSPFIEGFIQGLNNSNKEKYEKENDVKSEAKGNDTMKKSEEKAEKRTPENNKKETEKSNEFEEFYKSILFPFINQVDKCMKNECANECQKEEHKKTAEDVKPKKNDAGKKRCKKSENKSQEKDKCDEEVIQIPTFFGPIHVKVQKKSPGKKMENDGKQSTKDNENGNESMERTDENSHDATDKKENTYEKTEEKECTVDKCSEGLVKGTCTGVAEDVHKGKMKNNLTEELDEQKCNDDTVTNEPKHKETIEEPTENGIHDFVVIKDGHFEEDNDTKVEICNLKDCIVRVNENKNEAVRSVDDVTEYIVDEQSSVSGDEDITDVKEDNFVIDDSVQQKPDWRLSFDLSNFLEDEISVKINDRKLMIQAAHEEETEDGPVSEEFWKSLPIPKDVNTESIVSVLNDEGRLIVEGPRINVNRNIPVKSE